MTEQKDWRIFTVRLPPKLHDWLSAKKAKGGMNAAVVTALERMQSEEESEDYRRGFMNGYEKGKREKNET